MQYQCNIETPSIRLAQPATLATGTRDNARLEQLLQRLISERRRRSAHFAAGLFADPAWDILLVLALAETRQQRLSVTKLCERIGAPMTTALRWIRTLTAKGLLIRRDDVNDKRRKFLELSPDAFAAMTAYCMAADAPLALAA